MRVSLGGTLVVTATERWLSEIRGGRAFVQSGSLTALAANNSHVQLFNIAASPVTAIVRALVASRGAAGIVEIRTHNTALTTLASAGTNLLAGGAAGSAEVRTQQNAGPLGTLVGRTELLSATAYDLVREWFFELGAGEGVLVVPLEVNVSCTATFQWIEV